MSLLTEGARLSDVLLFEAAKEIDYTRDAIVLLSGGTACVVGQVLGKVTIGTTTAAAKGGGNTGTGTCTLVTSGGSAKIGVYKLICKIAGTNSATFDLYDPNGKLVDQQQLSGSGATAVFANDQIHATITDGGTDFVVGDEFDITVAAGSGKWVQVAPSAVDGSQNAAGICILAGDPTSADVNSVAVTRGPAIVKSGGLVWTSGMTDNQKAAAVVQLAALGITERTDYGV